jgi:hypothetical protein
MVPERRNTFEAEMDEVSDRQSNFGRPGDGMPCNQSDWRRGHEGHIHPGTNRERRAPLQSFKLQSFNIQLEPQVGLAPEMAPALLPIPFSTADYY